MILLSPRTPNRSAVTLVETVVVIGIIGILVALIMPAVQQTRAAADRVSCQSRLRQIGLGLHGYHDSHGAFPPGQDWSTFGAGDGSLQGVSWLAKILPFVEQQPLWERTAQALAQDKVPWNNPPHVGLTTIVPVYTCPSDSRVGSPQIGPDGVLAAYTSYLGVQGGHQPNSHGRRAPSQRPVEFRLVVHFPLERLHPRHHTVRGNADGVVGMCPATAYRKIRVWAGKDRQPV